MVALGPGFPYVASPTADPDPYSAFYLEVAAAQLASWLPPATRLTVLDLSRAGGLFAAQLAAD
ncbi:MAG: hypothetical protein QOK14_212, partial [Frankiaceae bacterium]|nr:hypothetical protein [Frankiaceae bacterium]